MTRPAGPAWLEGDTVRSTSAGDTENRWRGVFAELADGRLHALDELYDLAATDVYRLALWRIGSPEDAEDVVQDTFVKALGSLVRYRRGREERGAIEGTERLGSTRSPLTVEELIALGHKSLEEEDLRRAGIPR